MESMVSKIRLVWRLTTYYLYLLMLQKKFSSLSSNYPESTWVLKYKLVNYALIIRLVL